jgi:GST-like protein
MNPSLAGGPRLQRSSDKRDYTPMKRPLLLGCQGCGNAIVECAFALAGVEIDYEEVDYAEASPTRPRLLQFNPLGQVPTLVLADGSVMTESLAIVHYVDERWPNAGLIPPPAHEARAAFYRWAVFIVAAVYPTFTYGDDPAKWVPNEEGARQLRESTNTHRQALWRQVDAAARSPWFLGERRSALDIYLGVMTHWRPRREWFAANTPRIVAIAERLAALPEIAPVLKKNFP